MSIASAAGRPTRLRPVEARQPARATVTAAARRAMQAAAIPASLEAHRAAAAAALAPSQLLPEDRRPFVEALSRAALVAAAQRRRLARWRLSTRAGGALGGGQARLVCRPAATRQTRAGQNMTPLILFRRACSARGSHLFTYDYIGELTPSFNY